MTVKDWLAKSIEAKAYYNGTFEIQANRPRLYCNDGYPHLGASQRISLL